MAVIWRVGLTFLVILFTNFPGIHGYDQCNVTNPDGDLFIEYCYGNEVCCSVEDFPNVCCHSGLSPMVIGILVLSLIIANVGLIAACYFCLRRRRARSGSNVGRVLIPPNPYHGAQTNPAMYGASHVTGPVAPPPYKEKA